MTEKNNKQNYVGIDLEEFKRNYQGEWRIEKEDGDTNRLDADYNPERINLTIVQGVIVSVAYF